MKASLTPRARPTLTLLACGALGHCGSGEPVQGIYNATATVTQTCVPALTGQSARVPVLQPAAQLLSPFVPEPDAGLPAVRFDLDQSDAFSGSGGTVQGGLMCGSADRSYTLQATKKTHNGFTLDQTETWTNVSPPANAATCGLRPPSADCATTRRFVYTLVQACETPCQITDPLGCSCP